MFPWTELSGECWATRGHPTELEGAQASLFPHSLGFSPTPTQLWLTHGVSGHLSGVGEFNDKMSHHLEGGLSLAQQSAGAMTDLYCTSLLMTCLWPYRYLDSTCLVLFPPFILDL